MANESYFFAAAALTAAVVLGTYALLHRHRRRSLWSRIGQADSTVTVSEFIAHFRSNDRSVCIPEPQLDAIRRKGETLTNTAARACLTKLVDAAVVAARKFSAVEKRRLAAFDEHLHTSLLQDLWLIAFGPSVPFERLSEKWGRLGFQGVDPQTDLRGGGALALEQFHYFALRHTRHFKGMIAFNDRQGELKMNHWFLTAVVSIQFTVQIATQEHPIFLQHLQVIHEEAATRHEPRMPDKKKKDDAPSPSAAPPYDGLHELHARLMVYFFHRWQEELPHVMQYTQWIPRVYAEFFSTRGKVSHP